MKVGKDVTITTRKTLKKRSMKRTKKGSQTCIRTRSVKKVPTQYNRQVKEENPRRGLGSQIRGKQAREVFKKVIAS